MHACPHTYINTYIHIFAQVVANTDQETFGMSFTGDGEPFIHTYIHMFAQVVANTDRETFGMSFTDDGDPLDAIKIPCVMISSDVCEKLESCRVSICAHM